ncbi:hypothetical protein, partial [Campylobacter sp.]|uniref:hypothetical protein n=1 Tax=Campylobacter sp. TaxID=205 RepID=UPI0027062A8B|nr:hypothetical protein [Campylobacter sp.]
MKKFLPIAILTIFYGCGDNNIDTVKKYTFEQNKSMSIGVAIDGFKECESVKWIDESNKDQKIVSAICVVKPSVLKAEFEEINGKYEAAFKKEQEKNQEQLDKAVEKIVGEFERIKPGAKLSKEKIVQIADSFCKYEKDKLFPTSCDNEAITKALADEYAIQKGSSFALTGFVHNFSHIVFLTKHEVKPLWLGELPKEVKSREYKFSFFINTDNSVSVKEIVLT